MTRSAPPDDDASLAQAALSDRRVEGTALPSSSVDDARTGPSAPRRETRAWWDPKRWRPPMRGLHRDIGYVAVGLTFIYAVSGLALNHIADWDPNARAFEQRIALAAPLPRDEAQAVAQVLTQLGASGAPVRDVFRLDGELDIQLDAREIHVDERKGTILDRGKKNRVLLRIANWLHANRGKRAWTIVADAYAVALLFLAVSGMLMLPGRNGIRRRGAILVGLGVAIPVLYVALSGGP